MFVFAGHVLSPGRLKPRARVTQPWSHSEFPELSKPEPAFTTHVRVHKCARTCDIWGSLPPPLSEPVLCLSFRVRSEPIIQRGPGSLQLPQLQGLRLPLLTGRRRARRDGREKPPVWPLLFGFPFCGRSECGLDLIDFICEMS